MKRCQHPIVIIGAGLAGLFTALKLAPYPTLVIAAKSLGGGASSLWAQGGIAAAIAEGDTPEAHAQDTIKAGAGLVDKTIAHLVTTEARDRIEDLLNYGVPFDKDLEGKLSVAREAAHSSKRIVHVEGDRAGAAIMSAIIETAKKTPSIEFLEQVEVHKFESTNGKLSAIHLWPSNAMGFGESIKLKTSNVVLATGGVGHIYAKTTNPSMARGEGISMAARIGATIIDPEFVQFHPTAMDVGLDPTPLATEALRGEGATLINDEGVRFLKSIHQDAELAPRDIVARAVHNEIISGRGAKLDCRSTLGHRIKEHFPTVYNHCKTANIDPIKKPIPIAPAAHFHMGGIATDKNGQTSIKGLWACGEVASTGLHGANRLASNSLLEAVIFAKRIADDIKSQSSAISSVTENTKKLKAAMLTLPNIEKTDLTQKVKILRQTMFKNVGVVRSENTLNKALETMNELEPDLWQSERTKNMLITARFITEAALFRKESRGSHYRTDKPNNLSEPKHSVLHFNETTNSVSISSSKKHNPMSKAL